MATLPNLPEDLQNLPVLRKYLDLLRLSILEALDEVGSGGGGGGGGGDIKSDGTVPFAANESMGGNKLTNVGAPTVATDAANKTYVDTADAAVTVAVEAYSDAKEALDVRLDGSRPMTGALNLNTHLINNVVDPVSAQDAATKNYVDTHDKYAATFIVHPTAAQGTHTTIESAIAAVPVGGADIYVHEGTYTPTTMALPLARNVRLRGAGPGITNITAPTGVALFSVAGGATAEYFFAGFTVTGDGSFSQSLISLSSAVDVIFEQVEVSTFRTMVETSTTPEVTFSICKLALVSAGAFTAAFWRGSSTGGTLNWQYVEGSLTAQSSTGITGSPDWEVTASYIGGGPPNTTTYTLGKVTFQGFKADKSHFIIGTSGSTIVNLESIDGNVTVNNARTSITGSTFTTPTLSGTQLDVAGAGGGGGVVDVAITGCTFDGNNNNNSGINVANVQGVVIVGCSFINQGEGASTDSAIAVGDTGGTTKLTVVGCKFSGTIGGAQVTNAVYEFSGLGTIVGRYDDNIGFETSVIDSVFSTADGVRRYRKTAGTTTGVFVELFTHKNQYGVVGVGTIKNTGGVNSLNVKETVTDGFGVTDSVTTVVPFGNDFMLDPSANITTARPPYVSYKVEVDHPTAATTFNIQFSSTGPY
jgi:hypothetical protein